MAINTIFTGTTANDGTGDAIRTAFDTVNSNFDYIQSAVFAGEEQTQIKAQYVQGGYLISNTHIVANTYVNAGSIVANTVTSYGNLYVSQDGAYIVGNVSIIGNLTVSGSQAAAQAQASSASLLNLHYSATPLVLDDNKDIGLVWQYYTTGPEKKSFLGWQNSTESLVFWDDITENVSNVITAGTPGNVQIGSLLIANNTAATSNVTGALQVIGGVGIRGNTYVEGNLVVGSRANIANLSVTGFHVGNMYFSGLDTIYINGSPVQTAATAFNGGTVGLATIFNDATQSTSSTTGAVRIANGGLGVAGNIWAGNIHVNQGGNVRANVQGNIFTPAQPFITSLGTLTGLSVAGQLTSQTIIPSADLTFNLGGTSNRYQNIYGFNLTLTGTLSGATINSSGGTHTGNIALNLSNPGITTTSTGSVHLFNENATNVKIGASGTTYFDSNTQSTSTSSGAIISIGGVAIKSGNLYIGGSGGTAVVHTGDILPSSNLTANLGSSTAWYNTFFGVSTQARYADLAEKYLSDSDYEAGTVVVFGGEQEITVTNQFADSRVAGVISTNPAYLMNSATTGLPVALRGRVPVKIIGPVQKGDLLVTSEVPGRATSVGNDSSYGIKIFAKSLESYTGNDEKVIEAVIL